MPQDAISTSIMDKRSRHTLEWKIHWLFRLALVCEFVGHGAFGVLTKQGWVPYFGIFSIPDSWAWKLMPVVGSVDIALGTLALVAPIRAGLLYMGCRGLFTASLRPLAREGWWEFADGERGVGRMPVHSGKAIQSYAKEEDVLQVTPACKCWDQELHTKTVIRRACVWMLRCGRASQKRPTSVAHTWAIKTRSTAKVWGAYTRPQPPATGARRADRAGTVRTRGTGAPAYFPLPTAFQQWRLGLHQPIFRPFSGLLHNFFRTVAYA